jgi:cytochrome c peroxidase
MVAAFVSVRIARKSANAATRSADVAEVVERGRHYGRRIEGRTTDTDTPRKVYTLRNVGTIDARNVTLTGDYQHNGDFLTAP